MPVKVFKARKGGVGGEKIWEELGGEVETAVLVLQEGLGRSNGLEDTQGGLKSLMEVRGPDEGHAEGQTRPGVSNPGLLLDDAMVHPGRGFSPSKSLGQSWTLSWGLAVPGPAWDSR